MPLYFLSFILVISVTVTVHELGHYFVARLCSVRVEEFSIGFGKKLIGFRDKAGTEWKICLLPLGGYVKMYGDTNAASVHIANNSSATEEELQYSFACKNVWQRFAVVIAGPLANFILALVIYLGIFAAVGKPHIAFTVSAFTQNSPAQIAGVKTDDVIVSINGQTVEDINHFKELVNASDQISVTVARHCKECTDGSKYLSFIIRPIIDYTGDLKNGKRSSLLGINFKLVNTGKFIHMTPWAAISKSLEEVYNISHNSLQSIYQIAIGQRSFKEISGPVAIAVHSANATHMGIISLLIFISIISVSLGVVNLLPIPILDGGSLLLYIFEIIFRKPLPDRFQKIYYNVGIVFIATITVAVMFNDIGTIVSKQALLEKIRYYLGKL